MSVHLKQGDCWEVMSNMQAQSVNCCVTSPPYFGLRDYGVDGQLGLEETPEQYVQNMVDVFREVWRVLRDDGTVWLNLGDSYAGSGKGVGDDKLDPKYTNKARSRDLPKSNTPLCKPKDLIGIPWRVAFALQQDGWYLRQDIIWHKPNPMPESVTDRCTKAHEYVFLLTKSQRYYYDNEAIKEPKAESTVSDERDNNNGKRRDRQFPGQQTNGGTNLGGNSGNRNKRSVWTINPKPYPGAHYAVFPPDLIEPCVLAGCPPDGWVLDPFAGTGTTGQVASNNGRNAVLIELNDKDVNLIRDRCGLFLQNQ